MKTLFIEAYRKIKDYNLKELESLPKILHILYSIQYKQLAEKIKQELENKGFQIKGFEQVLGCSKIKPKASLLFIGSGRFHALQLAFSTKQPVYIYDNRISLVTKQEILDYEKKEKGKLARFLMSKNIGILISSKPGQNKQVDIKELKEKFPDKKLYIFIADNINLQELENFSMDFWINTACPGLELDSNKIINIEKILEI